jgi:hypothetical protein
MNLHAKTALKILMLQIETLIHKCEWYKLITICDNSGIKQQRTYE